MRPLLICFLLLSLTPLAQAQLPTEPVQGYVYVEAFEVRKEFAVNLRTLPEWQEAAEKGETIGPDRQRELVEEFTQTFTNSSPLEIDGKTPELTLDRISFVRIMDPEIGVIPDDREEIPVKEALIAAVFATATPEFPSHLVLDWDYFPESIEVVPVTFVSPSKRNTFELKPGDPAQEWTVPASEKLPTLFKVPAPPASDRVVIPIVSLILILVAAGLGITARIGRHHLPSWVGIASVGCVLGAFLTWNTAGIQIRDPYAEGTLMSEDEARELVMPLLRNIYHAFDYRDESRIYDTLEASVTGDLLEKIYLDIRKGLILEEQGGPRVKVTNVDLREVSAEPIGERSGVRADVEWIALGSVTHWGHVHQRLNKYHAWLTIEPVDGQWKVTGIEIIEEGRLS